MMNATIKRNEQYGSIEIAFPEKPSEAIRDELKTLKFRWNGKKGVWYGFADEELIRNVLNGNGANPAEKTENGAKKTEKPAEVMGVKVGDLFYISWGWEQTNINFFQVVSVSGKSSVRIKAVHPELKTEKAVSGMSRDVSFKIPDGMLDPVHSIFVDDDEKGDLHRLTEGYDGVCFKIEGRYTAKKYDGRELYESWYA